MEKLRTAPQFLEHYYTGKKWDILKAMRSYAEHKSDLAYEKWYQTAIKQLNLCKEY